MAQELDPKVVDQAVKTIQMLSVDAVQKANSGHPGAPMGLAAVAFEIWTKHLRFDPRDPAWPNRDRFVLSCGHASMLLYSLLHLGGYDVSLDDIKSFRQWGSKTPGHPEVHVTPGVETTTGPLGQGISNAVGMATGLKMMAARFDGEPGMFDARVFGLASDGDLMEGVSHEACSLAGHLGLGNLVFVYDDNGITIDGSTELAFSEQIDKQGSGRDRAAQPDHRQDDHRQGLAQSWRQVEGAWRAPRRRGDRAHQGGHRLAAGADLPRAGRGEGGVCGVCRAGRRAAQGVGRQARCVRRQGRGGG
jgi:transketolase